MTNYHDDPNWQSAHADYLREKQPNENVADVLVRRSAAAMAMYRIEVAHEKADREQAAS